ncbi:hypothetical protein V6N11_000673 [Hibiscus sabdariffa]|uniref:Uncharacterized protein n=1 Tax=Hibiscus sabdariffa TaxID=183260 RepID=A0ABR2RXE7_9ROSI
MDMANHTLPLIRFLLFIMVGNTYAYSKTGIVVVKCQMVVKYKNPTMNKITEMANTVRPTIFTEPTEIAQISTTTTVVTRWKNEGTNMLKKVTTSLFQTLRTTFMTFLKESS